MTAPGTDLVVAVIGAGTMGGGIAQVAAQAGHTVLVFDSQIEACDALKPRIQTRLVRQVDRGRMAVDELEAILARLKPCGRLEELAAADIVIEAVLEDLALKQRLFRDVEGIVRPDAILATNTSTYPITEIATGLVHPGRVVGMHFFNPAPVMPLVEVVSGLATNPEVAERVFALAVAWGKRPVHATSTPGFIVNRVARPFYAEALRLVEERAADPATIDAIVTECGGFRMGPFDLMDLIGLDVNYAVTCSVHQAFFGDPRFQPSQLQRSYVQAGRLGRKTGRGFYRYEDGASKPAPASHRKGEPPTEIVVSGDLGPAQSLIDLAREAGIQVHFSGASVPDGGRVIMGDVVLALTDGRTATERARWEGQPNLAVFDLALDFRTATRVAIAAADSARPLTSDVAAGFFQALGKAVSVIDDTPALVVMRTVSMLANFAADAVHQGVASGADIDIAMKTGTNYPLGPLAWANVVGPARLCQVLGNLSTFYGDGRYRVSPLLQRVAMTGGAFRV